MKIQYKVEGIIHFLSCKNYSFQFSSIKFGTNTNLDQFTCKGAELLPTLQNKINSLLYA